MPKKVSSNIEVFNFSFAGEMKDQSIEKACEKSLLVIYAYNNKDKNLVLMNLLKISKIRPSIIYCLASII